MKWLILIIAGLFEVAWAYYLKRSDGFSHLLYSSLFLVTLGISMGLLAFSLKSIPIGIAYPIWTGIGAVGSVLVGYFLFKEPMTSLKVLFTVLILVGIIGLKSVSSQ